MELIRDLVTAGLSARATAKIKVRQSLASVEVVLGSSEESKIVEHHSDVIKDELNIKEIKFSDSPEKYVSYEVLPNFKLLGKKLGKQMGPVQKALKSANGSELYKELSENNKIVISVGEDKVELSSEEVEIRLQAKEGFAAEQGKKSVVILSTDLTPELKREGMAKDLIRSIQNLRKEMNLEYNARIVVGLKPKSGSFDAEFAKMLKEHESSIMGEVLADELNDSIDAKMKVEQQSIEDTDFELGVLAK